MKNFLLTLLGLKKSQPVPQFESQQMAEEKVWGTVRDLRELGYYTFSFEEVIQFNPNLPSGWIIRASKQTN